MTEKIPGGNTNMIPHLVCSPAADAIEFYKKAFNAEELARIPSLDGQKIMHAALSINGGMLFLADDFPEYCGGKSQTATSLGGNAVTIHRYVEDCDAAIAQAEAAGATVRMPASDMFWGDRYGMVIDPFGHAWAFATHQQDLTMEEMKEAARKAMCVTNSHDA